MSITYMHGVCFSIVFHVTLHVNSCKHLLTLDQQITLTLINSNKGIMFMIKQIELNVYIRENLLNDNTIVLLTVCH